MNPSIARFATWRTRDAPAVFSFHCGTRIRAVRTRALRRIPEIFGLPAPHIYVPSQKLSLASRRTAAAVEVIARSIYVMRGQKVMLDRDLAELYRVPTKVFNQAVKRNRTRFPSDFVFELTVEEANCLRSQFVTSKMKRGGRRYRPYAFTQEGVAMLSSVLRSSRAVQVNVAIMRAFVKLRQVAVDYANLAHKLDELERRCDTHDHSIKLVFGTLKKLFQPPVRPHPRIGFVRHDLPGPA